MSALLTTTMPSMKLIIVVAPNGALWFGTVSDVSRFDGESWTTFTKDDGLASNYAQSVAVGPDGAVWFGTGGGISRYLRED